MTLKADVTESGLQAQLTSKGPIGVFLTLGLGVFLELAFLDPLHSAQHFMLTLLTMFGAGAAAATGVCLGRVRDALQDKEYYRAEVNRMAEAKSALHELIVKKHLSSDDLGPRGKGRGPKS